MIDSKTFPDKESIKSFLLYQKGLSLLNLEKYDEAIECFDMAIKIDDDADAWHNRGVAFGNLRKDDKP